MVSDAAQPGGRSQVVAHLRERLATTPACYLAPPGPALQWKAALALSRIVFFSEMVNAARKSMIETILATAGAWTLPNSANLASRWRIFVGTNQWPDYQVFLGRRINRKHELRTIVHSNERQEPQFQNMPNVMNLLEFLASLGQLEKKASIMGMCNR